MMAIYFKSPGPCLGPVTSCVLCCPDFTATLKAAQRESS
jgi:coenzyme F420-reducing hydrogenase gamma subunit